MNKKNIIPQAAKPVVRVTQGTSRQLAELSEEVLSGIGGVAPANVTLPCVFNPRCSMDDDAE
ncbi:MAG: DUF5837 family cyanobactin class RiPP [Rivularia sp. (in: cyanobacteria)]